MVENPRNVNIISKNAKLIAALMELFIKETLENQEFSNFTPFHRVKQEGFWRYLVVRESDRTKQSMMVVVAKTEGFEPELVQKVK